MNRTTAGLPTARNASQISFAVESPEIEEVLDCTTGENLAAATVIGEDYYKALQLRMRIRTDLEDGHALYRCSLCRTPVYLVSLCEVRRFFFRHTLEDGRCTAHTRGALSQDEIDARKYNGAKESAAHRDMKMWVAQCLEADPRFSDVHVEGTWVGALTGERRKPDVRATLDGKVVVFEIQLSTTHLNVIAARRSFYLREGALLVWVFKNFDTDSRRLTQDDVFFNNNQNAFVVSKETLDISTGSGGFALECIWAEPLSLSENSPLQRKLVSFHELTLDFENQRAFYFDYDGARRALETAELAKTAALRTMFEEFWLAYTETHLDDAGVWRTLRTRIRALGVDAPTYPSQLPRSLLNALYSAKHGKPVGFRFLTLVQVAHHVAGYGRKHLFRFRQALAAFDRGAQLLKEDMTGKWTRRAKAYKAAIKQGSKDYEPDLAHDALVALLFPELESRPLRQSVVLDHEIH